MKRIKRKRYGTLRERRVRLPTLEDPTIRMPGRFSKTPSSSPILSFVFRFLFLARRLVYLREALRLVTVTATPVVSKQLTAVTSPPIAQSRLAVDARPSSMIGGRCVFSFDFSDFGFDLLGFYALLRLSITVVWKGCRSGARSFF
jgi:hypothetical protein